MPTYRYNGKLENGTPVFGTMEAESEPHLRQILAQRSVGLLQCHVLTLDRRLASEQAKLPRMHQLRVGERLREAILTGLPAHDAIRAMAAEPFQHPLLSIMPWVFGLSVVALIPAALWALVVPGSYLPFICLLCLSALVLPCLWSIGHYYLDGRPRSLLESMASQLEQGNLSLVNAAGLPVEVNAVIQSGVDDEKKALAVADLVPKLMGSRYYHHRFLMTIVSSVAITLTFVLGLYLIVWQIVPEFGKIFEDFGSEVPYLTQLVVGASTLLATGGWFGFLFLTGSGLTLLVFLYVGMSIGAVAEALSHVPVFGSPIRWLMQARVARVLASMLKFEIDRSESLRAATAASAFPDVRTKGAYLADEVRAGKGITIPIRDLSGLPLSLLAIPQSHSGAVAAGDSSDKISDISTAVPRNLGWSDQKMAANFNTLAQMLEQASVGHGRFIGLILQYSVTLISAFMIGVVVISLFLPLIKLLNDLA
ncbi:MAG: hypothetical protein KDA91_02400 [Planctomycetaceae bacterium]|nr:hypothetical protein [Planctomycetaceae bacterium]